MPRVSDEYLEQRRRQILDATQRCFARKGFYETSMRDVFAEAGLSAGAVYRYFKSKDELVQAISARVFGHIGTVIESALAEDPLPGLDEIAARVATAIGELSGEGGPAWVGPAAWAAALHDPALAVTVRDMFGRLRAGWVQAARRMIDTGRLPADTDVRAIGITLVSLLPGFLLQHLILGDADAATLRKGLRELLAPQLLSPANGHRD